MRDAGWKVGIKNRAPTAAVRIKHPVPGIGQLLRISSFPSAFREPDRRQVHPRIIYDRAFRLPPGDIYAAQRIGPAAIPATIVGRKEQSLRRTDKSGCVRSVTSGAIGSFRYLDDCYANEQRLQARCQASSSHFVQVSSGGLSCRLLGHVVQSRLVFIGNS